MSGMVKWLAERRARRVMLMAGLFPLPFLGVISAAIVVFTGALRGPREGLLDCSIALLLIAGIAVIAGTDPVFLTLTAAGSWLVWLGLGGIAGRSAAITLAVQIAVVLTVAALGAFLLLVDNPAALWAVELEKLYAEMARQQLLDVEVDIAAQAELMTGAAFSAVLISVLVPLMLGVSWAAQVTQAAFAAQFRDLRLGLVIGGLAAVVGVLALAGVNTHGALLVFGVAFVVQGIAVLAWWAHTLTWPGWWWWLLVALPLVFPAVLFVLVLTLLAAVGFVDNWYGLRRRLD